MKIPVVKITLAAAVRTRSRTIIIIAAPLVMKIKHRELQILMMLTTIYPKMLKVLILGHMMKTNHSSLMTLFPAMSMINPRVLPAQTEPA